MPGEIIQNMWSELPGRFSQIDVDSFVAMPNHIHGVIVVGAQFIAPSNSPPGMVEDAARGAMNRAPTVGEVIRVYKAVSARAIRSTISADFRWQRNYYEHVIRSEESLNRIRQYIIDNPARWAFDRENPVATAGELDSAY